MVLQWPLLGNAKRKSTFTAPLQTEILRCAQPSSHVCDFIPTEDYFFNVYNSKWRKQRNSIGLLTNIKIIFLIWNSKYKHTIKKFHYWNKHGNVKENVFCTSSGKHLLWVFLRHWVKRWKFFNFLLWHQN